MEQLLTVWNALELRRKIIVVAATLGDLCTPADVIIPCSSGGAFTVMMQTFETKPGQVMVTNKGLAAMGYGLSGAIGADQLFQRPLCRLRPVHGSGAARLGAVV